MNDIVQRCYEVLHLPHDASRDEVRRAHAALMQRQDSKSPDWEQTKEVDRAYEILMEYLAAKEREEGDIPPIRPTAGSSAGGIDRHELVPEPGAVREGASDWFKRLFLADDEKTNPLALSGRALIFLFAVIWGFSFIVRPLESNYTGGSFMHLINLPFHEAGHVIFSPFGEFITYLGGTLMQVLIPAICMVAFLRQGDRFGASVALWWIGQSLIDAAPYINDARARELVLLGGVTGQDVPEGHDWYVLLGKLGLLNYDRLLAHLTQYGGSLLMLLSFAWGGYMLYVQFRNRNLSESERKRR